MDAGTIVVVLITAVGVGAGLVQIIDFFSARRRKTTLKEEGESLIQLPAPLRERRHNLPARTELIGRAFELERVIQGLMSRSPIVCIDGIGGIGKTSLAVEVAHKTLTSGNALGIEHVVWVSCREAEANLEHLLSTIARVLDYPSANKASPEQKTSSIQQLLRENRVLVVVDNFEEVRDDSVERFLRSIPEPSKALLTSRHHIPGDTWVISLTGLAASDGIALIRAEGVRLNLHAIQAADDTVLLRIFSVAGGVPIAIKWAVGQIKQRGQTIDGVIELLRSARSNIFEAIFAKSWSLLTRRSRRVLVTLSILPSPASSDTIRAGSKVHQADIEEAVGQLVEMSLVDVAGELGGLSRRYSVHPMTRAFANSKLERDPRLRLAIVRRLLRWYLEGARTAEQVGQLGYDQLAAELENFLHIAIQGFTVDWDAATTLSSAARWFLWESGFWPEIVSLSEAGLQQAAARADHVALGRYSKEIAWVRCRQNDYENALIWSSRTREYWKFASVPNLEIADLASLGGLIERGRGNREAAKALLTDSLEAYREDGRVSVEMLRVLTYLGELELAKGDLAAAKHWFSETLTSAQEARQQAAVAWSFENLAEVEFAAGNYAGARKLFERGLAAGTEIARYHTIANCAFRLGNIMEMNNDGDRGADYYRLALDKYLRLGITSQLELVRDAIARVESSQFDTEQG
ncbi:MAG TPA: NB-ARC domain-containing protein [Micromonosporaceae bacterium]|nr:NB-ARC domain-containing protein [Micromonosporaceae bacterium]